jgi:protein TonB
VKNKISTTDKNILTFTISALFIATLILGIVFTTDDSGDIDLFPNLDVILSKQVNNKESEKADFLSQNDQQGGGDSDQPVRPQNIEMGIAPEDEGSYLQEKYQQVANNSKNNNLELVTAKQSKQKVTSEIVKPENNLKIKPNSNTESEAQRLAKLENNISERIEAYAKRPKSKYISASTKSFEFANYMHSWVKKIERISNLNYPDEARIRDFVGSLIMTVGINANGKIEEIKILKSSGFKSIDDSAIHLVEISGPFEPLPENKNKIDILYITRTWQFLPGNKLRNL